MSDRPHIDNGAADDLDASCDLAEFEAMNASPQRTATRLLRESSRVEAFSDGVSPRGPRSHWEKAPQMTTLPT